MLFHPNDRILLTRKTFGAAADEIKAISQAMQTRQIQELFKQAHGRYPKAVMSREGRLTYNFKKTITPEGNIIGMGIDQGITGLHFDKIVNDDFITLRDRISKAERERTKEIVREIQTNIIDPGKGSIWTGTPWHREDAWKVINTFCPIARYPISENCFLPAELVEMKKRTTTPYLYSANYELDLKKDESLLFSEPIFSTGWDYSKPGVMAQVDAAYDGTHFCALTIASPTRKEGGNQYYQAIGFAYPGNIKDWVPQIAKLCKKYRVGYVYTESNPDKGYTADKMREHGLRVKDYSEGMNKYLKISTCLFDAWPFIEWSPDCDEEYMMQITDWKEGIEPDDAPDSASSLFREAFGGKKKSAWALYQ
jgi:hypothetical protein